MSFPRWKYTPAKIPAKYGDLVREDFTGRIIASQEELDALGGVWYDTPTELRDALNGTLHLPEPIPETREELIEFLEFRGIKYDKRWGVEKLREAAKGD